MSQKPRIVHLIRHGETDHNATGRFVGVSDPELTERGLAQARAAAAQLAGRPIAAVHTSPLARARQTAGPIAEAHGLTPVPRPELAELHHGELEGLPYSALSTRFPELMTAWRTDPSTARLPGGESLAELRARVWPAFEDAVAATEGELCVVSHKMALTTIVCGAIGLELKHAMRLELELGSVSTLELRPDRGWKLLALNSTAHLPRV